MHARSDSSASGTPGRVRVVPSGDVIKTRTSPAATTAWGASAAPKTVVVIDNEPDNVDLTVMVLQAAGHTALGTTAVRNGVGLAVHHAADVVVLDYQMPDMNGAEVGKALRAHPITMDIKIVMHSATPEATIRASFTQYDAYVAKPAPGLRLLQAIAAL